METGDLLARLQLDDASTVRRALPYTEPFPDVYFTPPHPVASVTHQPHLVLSDALRKLQMLLKGYKLGPGVLERSIEEMMRAVRNPLLPLCQFTEIYSSLAGRVPEVRAAPLPDVSGVCADVRCLCAAAVRGVRGDRPRVHARHERLAAPLLLGAARTLPRASGAPPFVVHRAAHRAVAQLQAAMERYLLELEQSQKTKEHAQLASRLAPLFQVRESAPPPR